MDIRTFFSKIRSELTFSLEGFYTPDKGSKMGQILPVFVELKTGVNRFGTYRESDFFSGRISIRGMGDSEISGKLFLKPFCRTYTVFSWTVEGEIFSVTVYARQILKNLILMRETSVEAIVESGNSVVGSINLVFPIEQLGRFWEQMTGN
ncbi:MAG: hypothetical protein JXR95_01365 [Deltaproteobacteria bacterium]|nr:hypothetical protein [Deltaproteobacteria bacterium]